MKAVFTVVALIASMAMAGPSFLKERFPTPATDGDSGCYPFEDPDCGVDYAVCQCANGCFYKDDNGANCQPPGGYLGCSESSIPGFTCG